MSMTDTTVKTVSDATERVATQEEIAQMKSIISDIEMFEKRLSKQAKKDKVAKATLKKAKARLKKIKAKSKGKKRNFFKRFWSALKRKIKSALKATGKMFKKAWSGVRKVASKMASILKAARTRVSHYLAGSGIIPTIYRALKKSVLWVGSSVVAVSEWIYAGSLMILSGASLGVSIAALSVLGAGLFLIAVPLTGKSKKKAKAKARKAKAQRKAAKAKARKNKARRAARRGLADKKVSKSDAKALESLLGGLTEENAEQVGRDLLGDEVFESLVANVTEELGGVVVDDAPTFSETNENQKTNGKGRPTPSQKKTTNRRHHGARVHNNRSKNQQSGNDHSDNELAPF